MTTKKQNKTKGEGRGREVSTKGESLGTNQVGVLWVFGCDFIQRKTWMASFPIGTLICAISYGAPYLGIVTMTQLVRLLKLSTYVT